MTFPKGFLWGVSLAGFQFEMGDPEGRAIDPNTDWFAWVHDEKNIRRGVVSGDLPEHGIDYWHRFREDHELAQSLGMNAYRLNIEWSRVFPKPTYSVEVGVEREEDLVVSVDIDESDLARLDELADKAAVQHYREVIEDLRSRGFYVILNLVHFTLPLWLHDPITARDTNLRRGPLGYADPRFPVEFAKFAAYAAWRFGDLVDTWSTFNEPSVVTEQGYLGQAKFPPGVMNFKGYRRAMLNIAQAHVLAYDLVKRFDRTRAYAESPEPASVGIIHNLIPFHPLRPGREKDVAATRTADYLHNRWILHAILDGAVNPSFDWRREGETIEKYRGKLDWLGVNYYSRSVVAGRTGLLSLITGLPAVPVLVENYGYQCEPRSTSAAGRPTSDFGWEIYPEGLAEVLSMAVETRKPVLVTENGIADAEDRLRPHYIALHLKVLESFLEERQGSVTGYLHWALTDNYEWADGFRMRFGLFHVDLETKRRAKRPSADLLARIIAEGAVPEDSLKAAEERTGVKLAA
uniref:Glycoside hydrolase family 1 protein n=1 Tax=Thermofilum pendens TaxID=2269 RepID=A0A7J3X4K2_THEPE